MTSPDEWLEPELPESAGERRGLLRRRADLVPILYLTSIYAFLFWGFFRFTSASVPARIAIFWIGLILATRTEAILHWTTHFPAFASRRLNRLHRLYYSVLPRPALWYAYHHFQHHRYDNTLEDLSTTLEEKGEQHLTLPRYVYLSFVVGDIGPLVDKMPASYRRECAVSLVISGVIALALFIVDWRAALLFWVPVVGPGSMALNIYYNYTDHVPSDPGDSLRYATYDPLRSWYRRFLSWVDLHNIATHMTHHRFPSVYWTDLPARQAEMLSTYEAAGTPRTYGLDSTILFNPIALLVSAWRVNRARRAIAVTARLMAVRG